ncbi:MAG: roadblock/LC7 domain-containing protein [Bryobacterales bacterium]|nr:roadblock/LC7 domain-containing protein [Bryobacterales bacterium]
MAQLKALLSELAGLDGVSGAVVVSRDGFVIEGESRRDGFEADAVGAVVSAGIGASEGIAADLRLGGLHLAMLECQGGVLMIGGLGPGAVLAVLSDARANLGNIRFQVKKRLPELEQAL